MQENIIAISNTAINGESIQTCNARELHAFLEVKRDFSNWIKDQIQKYDFVENEDFVKISSEITLTNFGERDIPEKFGQAKIDYFLTLDMAKELAMVSRTAKGKEARKYFIECERVAKLAADSNALLRNDLTDKLAYSIMAAKALESLGVPQSRAMAHAYRNAANVTGVPLDDIVKALPAIPTEEVRTLNATQLGKRLTPPVGARRVNKMFEEIGFQERVNNQWRLTKLAKGFGEMRPYERNGHSDYQIQWGEEVLAVLQEKLDEEEGE